MTIGLIVQARLGSSRFPRKALADLHGRPLLWHVVKAAEKIRGVDSVVVAVPWQEQEWYTMAMDETSALPRASYYGRIDIAENDVLGRFARCVEQYPHWDAVVRITGDCPLLDPAVSSRVVEAFRYSSAAYVSNDVSCSGFPDGLDTEVFSRDLLFAADRLATSASDREHVTPWMRRDAWRNSGLVVDDLGQYKAYRHAKWSVDSPEDLETVRAVLAERGTSLVELAAAIVRQQEPNETLRALAQEPSRG